MSVQTDLGGRRPRSALEVKIVFIGGQWRIDLGDESSGRWIVVSYDEIVDYVLGSRPIEELIDIYFSGDDEKD